MLLVRLRLYEARSKISHRWSGRLGNATYNGIVYVKQVISDAAKLIAQGLRITVPIRVITIKSMGKEKIRRARCGRKGTKNDMVSLP